MDKQNTEYKWENEEQSAEEDCSDKVKSMEKAINNKTLQINGQREEVEEEDNSDVDFGDDVDDDDADDDADDDDDDADDDDNDEHEINPLKSEPGAVSLPLAQQRNRYLVLVHACANLCIM